MKNIITASIAFSFKGERHNPSITLMLETYMEKGGCFPDIYPLIARENGFDLYSYEYEMMQAEPVKFGDAQGLVADHLINDALDIPAFEQAWRDERILMQLQSIIKDTLGIDDLEQHPDLKEVLLKACRLGATGVY